MIRYDSKLTNEINRVVRNFNNKIARLNRSNRVDIFIPDKITKEDIQAIKSQYKNRSDLRRRLKEFERFNKRHGEDIISFEDSLIPKYQSENIKAYQRLINRRLSAREKALATSRRTYAGIEQPINELTRMFSEENRNIKALKRISSKDIATMSYREREKYLEQLRTNAKTFDRRQWRDNYVQMLLDVGYTSGIEHYKLHEIKVKLQKLSLRDFEKLVNEEDLFKNIIFSYKTLNDVGVDTFIGDEDQLINSEGSVQNLAINSLYEDFDEIVASVLSS